MKEGRERLPQIYEEEKCVICFEENPSYLFEPCFHLCCCEKCSSKLENCPLCGKELLLVVWFPRDLHLDLQTHPPAVLVNSICYDFVSTNLKDGKWASELDYFDVEAFFTVEKKEGIFVRVTKTILNDVIESLFISLPPEAK